MWVQPRKISLWACIRCCPATTRSPSFLYWLRPANSARTDSWASLACRTSGSTPSPASISAIQAQVPPVGLQGAPVLAHHGADLLVDRGGLDIGEEVLDRDDRRRVADDPPLTVDLGRELGQGR